ncbi:MAG: hypothetical protein UHK52_05660 [Bacteroidales bacterium]|nr:hypothetical protein [Bacteroidales bacterium]
MLYLCKLKIEQKNIMEKEQSNNQQSNNQQSNNQQSNNQQANNIVVPDDYYIQQSRASHLKESICVQLTQNDVQPTNNYGGCLILKDKNTAKAITCLLRNIDKYDTPCNIIIRLVDIVAHLGLPSNQSNPYYEIPCKDNGLDDKAVNRPI